MKPAIPSQFANGQAHYMCMRCVEKKQARERDKMAISKPEVRGVVNNNNSKSTNSVRKRRSFPYDVRIQTEIVQLKKILNAVYFQILGGKSKMGCKPPNKC